MEINNKMNYYKKMVQLLCLLFQVKDVEDQGKRIFRNICVIVCYNVDLFFFIFLFGDFIYLFQFVW